MIDFYLFPSPNAWKVSIMLEECMLSYQIKVVDITQNRQFDPEFLKVSPNNRIPAIVDHDAQGGEQSVFESGAILLYLAEKTGRFLSRTGPSRVAALEWLFWQVGGLGPMGGQAHHFLRYKAGESSYATERYTKECSRLYSVLDRRLNGRDWIADDYGIADMACWGWIWFHRMHGQELPRFPNVERWFFEMARRPAVQRGKAVALDVVPDSLREMLDRPYFEAPVA